MALLVQALGYEKDDLEGRFLEQPQEEADPEHAAMNLYNIMNEDTGDTGTSDETGPPSEDFMRDIMDQPPAPEDGKMAYDQFSIDTQDLKKEIDTQPLPIKNLLPISSG